MAGFERGGNDLVLVREDSPVLVIVNIFVQTLEARTDLVFETATTSPGARNMAGHEPASTSRKAVTADRADAWRPLAGLLGRGGRLWPVQSVSFRRGSFFS